MLLAQYLVSPDQYKDSRSDLVHLLAAKAGVTWDALVTRNIMTPVGMHKTVSDSATGVWKSNVDELYRWELRLSALRLRPPVSAAAKATEEEGAFNSATIGWMTDAYRGLSRASQFGDPGGKRHAFMRFPAQRAAIIILTDRPATDTKAIAERIADRLLFTAK